MKQLAPLPEHIVFKKIQHRLRRLPREIKLSKTQISALFKGLSMMDVVLNFTGQMVSHNDTGLFIGIHYLISVRF